MNSHTTKIAVLGAGSIGCFLGGLLVSQGCEVVFIGRDKLKAAVAEKGLTLTHFNRDPIHISAEHIAVTTEASTMSQADLILVCTKSQDTEQAAHQIMAYAKPSAHILSCQNGLSNAPLLRKILGDKVAHISGAIVPFNVTPTEPASYHCGTGGAFHVEHDLPEDVMTTFRGAGQDIICGGNFEGDQWAKLLVNLNNALNALSGGTLREGLLQKDYRLALSLIVEEGLGVAEAHNVTVGNFNWRTPSMLVKMLRLPNLAYKIIMQLIVKIDAKARSSMLDDLETGRLSEIDYLQGEIVRQAQRANLTAPHNKAILEAIKTAFENGTSPKMSGTDILTLLKGKN